jgi:CDP-glucose 4,6-dehydratase
MTSGFWQGKKIFLTGHTGFKGSWLSLWLQNAGAEVTGYALKPPTPVNMFEMARVGENMRSIEGDVRDLDRLKAELKTANPDIVIHMAAQSLVRLSYDAPVETYATNVMGTVNILEAVRQCSNVKVVLNVTTDKCYENNGRLSGYREEDTLGGYDPYSNSKACSELVTASYRSSFFQSKENPNGHPAAVATARSGNVIGGGDWAKDRLLTDIIDAFEQKKPVAVRYPHAVRPWQHVLEPLSGYAMLIERLYEDDHDFAEGWNFGPDNDDAKPVSWIVEQMTAAWGGVKQDWQGQTAPQPHEASFLKLDCTKARSRLGWAPRWRIDKALSAVVDWHKARLDGHDMRDFSLRQIKEFVTDK